MTSEVQSFYFSCYLAFQSGLMTLALGWMRVAPVFFFYRFSVQNYLITGLLRIV